MSGCVLRLPLQAQIPLISQVLMILWEKLDRGGMRSGNIPVTQWDHRHITVISIEIRVPLQQFSVSGPSLFACSVVRPPVTEVQTHVGFVALCVCVQLEEIGREKPTKARRSAGDGAV